MKIEDKTSPVVTIVKAGTVVVRATMAQDDKYEKATAEYSLTIEAAEQSFTFKDGATVIKNYGIKEFYNEPVSTVLVEKADGKGYGNGAYTFVVETNGINAKLSNDGKTIVFGDSEAKIGTVTVNVTKAADECYKECSASYTIEIKYPSPSPAAKDLLISKTLNANGWYDGDIEISAPTGYEISYDNELISTTDWAASVPYSVEGTTCPVIYLKAANGDISDAITVTDYKMDKSSTCKS